MLLVQRNDMIEHFAASTADPALSDSVLPGAPSTGANKSNVTGFQKLENIAAEFGVAVEEDVPVATGKRQSVAQLSHDLIARQRSRPPLALGFSHTSLFIKPKFQSSSGSI